MSQSAFSLSDVGAQLPTGLNGVSLLVWTTKALVLRAHPKADFFNAMLINSLKSVRIAKVSLLIADGSPLFCRIITPLFITTHCWEE
jgi:hypothetical protein